MTEAGLGMGSKRDDAIVILAEACMYGSTREGRLVGVRKKKLIVIVWRSPT